jgi:hypothetical protein
MFGTFGNEEGSPTVRNCTVPNDRWLFFPVANFVLLEDNLFGVDAGVYGPAVDDGYYMLLKPFAAGQHTIRIRGGERALGFLVDVIYNLDVVEPGPVIVE